MTILRQLRRAWLPAAGLLAAGCAADPAGSSPAPEALSPTAAAIRALAGARTRVTWIQDTGDGSDYLARGTALQLMGFDTDDGRGERVLLQGPRNIAKPLFTGDGERIVFSDRHKGSMVLVGWDGGAPKRLGRGFALQTWRDPETGIEWLYYAKGKVDDGKLLPTHGAIYRKALPPYPLNRHTLRLALRGRLGERRIWRLTPVSEDSYQLSADGRYAAAVFPWPEAGIHDVREGRWRRLGRGCWVAMAPDNSYLFWIFDGPHRNLIMERFGAPERERWSVPVHRLPDTDRYEVYHPRWSNHPRILAVTGPYKVGEGSYRLPGGGADVEIQLGRFAADHRSIEQWVTLTDNDRANFYPDVWVEPGPTGAYSGAPAAVPPPEDSRPVGGDALLYLWEHGAADNTVGHGDDRKIFRPQPGGLARFGRRHEMWLTGGWFTEPEGLRLPPAYTFEAFLRSPGPAAGEALIVGFGPQAGWFEREGGWFLRDGDRTVALGKALPGGAEAHLALSVAPDRVRLYIDGQCAADVPVEAPLLSGREGPLFFGGLPGAEADWAGRLSHLAFHGRVLDEREILRHARLLREAAGSRPAGAPETVRARVVEQSALPAPEDIAPYRRALVVHTYEVTEGERTGERFLAAHWAILDGRVLEGAERSLGTERMLAIEPFDQRPELEGERVVMDGEAWSLDLYYDLNL